MACQLVAFKTVRPAIARRWIDETVSSLGSKVATRHLGVIASPSLSYLPLPAPHPPRVIRAPSLGNASSINFIPFNNNPAQMQALTKICSATHRDDGYTTSQSKWRSVMSNSTLTHYTVPYLTYVVHLLLVWRRGRACSTNLS
jgi:hypothetical protein